jgi:DNA-directed RNA polymerase subunit RPC12/RpoP
MFKENGRKKPADPKETANTMGKTYECGRCGHTEVRRNVEFGEAPRCPKCYRGTLMEKLDV